MRYCGESVESGDSGKNCDKIALFLLQFLKRRTLIIQGTHPGILTSRAMSVIGNKGGRSGNGSE